MKLTDREWKEFYIKDIFICENKKKVQVPTGAYIHKENLIKGRTPRITVTSQNNGIDGYFNSNDGNYRIYNNFISVSFLGTIFYHPYSASIDMKVHCLQLIDYTLNIYISKFLISEIKKSIEMSSYGNQLSSTDLPNKKVMIPVDNSGNPDYSFMEEYVREEEKRKKEKYITYAKKQLETLQYIEVPALEEKEWGEFSIGGDNGIFIISSGKRLTKADMDNGKIPFIGATDSNNGITNWVGTPNSTLDSNVLGVNYNGSVVENFYHPYLCLFSDDVKRLHLKNYKDNKYILLFFKSIILNQKNKYTYGYKFNAHRMERQKILLPIDEHGIPDYVYMEQYAKNLIIVKLKKYLAFAKKK